MPAVTPQFLPASGSGSHDWNYVDASIFHDGIEISTDLPHLNHLNTQNSVGFLISADGHLHVYLNGRHVKKIPSLFQVNHFLWGAVHVGGNCTKIKSELLSGELSISYIFYL